MRLSHSLIIHTSLLSLSVVLCSLSVAAQTPEVRARVTQAVDVENRVTLRGNIHPLARAEFDRGTAPDDLPMARMLLVLRRGEDQETALRQLLEDQQVKSSPHYHQWLAPEEFGQRFGPADADIQAATAWLTGQGFQVNQVAAGRTVIEFSGSAGLVRQGLRTEIHKFAVNGKEHWANVSDPQIPAALAPVVAGFASLNNFPRKPLYRRLGTFSRSKLTGEVQPLFTYPVGYMSYAFALGPTDFAIIYNLLPLWNAGKDGTGQTIAVVGRTNINIEDVRDFRSMFGLPAKDPNIILNGPDPGIWSLDEEGEADLDVEWSGAVARGATIDFVVSESTEATDGVDLSALYIIDNNLAPVMSESFGACEASLGVGGNAFYNTLWEQATAQGITVVIATGDSGSATCDAYPETAAHYGLAVSGTASTPFNVAVGGTDFDDLSNPLTYWDLTNTSGQSSAKSYIPEMTWNDSCANTGQASSCTTVPSYPLAPGIDLTAGGGGPSSCTNPTGTFPNFSCTGGHPKPSWQTGAGVPNDSARDVPDVSLFAGDGLNYTFYVICQMDANASVNRNSCDLGGPFGPYNDFEGVGGTSASAPAFAGIMALVNQVYGRQGNANYALYPLAVQTGNSCTADATAVSKTSCIFYDIRKGNNSVACVGGSRNCSNTSSSGYGIMVSGSPASAAWTTTTGYDLATGLGSVNVANLVNKWNSVSFTPTATTLSLSTSPATDPITLTHGQSVNLTINVAPKSGSGTPTGDVSLIAQPRNGQDTCVTTGLGSFTLSGGSVTSTTSMLPGGTCGVTAHYTGNGTYAASDSTPPIQVTVGKENSQTKIGLVTPGPAYGATTAAYGSAMFLRVDVTNSSSQLCASSVYPATGLISYPCPAGTVNVTVNGAPPSDQGNPLGSVPGTYLLNSHGYAEDQYLQLLLPGTYNFVASYAGDNSYNPSQSPTVPITITKAPTATTVSAPSSVVGPFVNLTATVNTQSYGVAPTGTVQFLNDGAPIGVPVQVIGPPFVPSTGPFATAGASWPAILPVGTASITAQYSGDSNYAPSTSAAATVTVTDFSLSADPTTIIISAPGQSGTSTLTITPLGGFTGTVNLSVLSFCPTGATCTVSPSSVNVTGSSAVTTTLTVKTTANSSVQPFTPQRTVPPSSRLSSFWWPWLLAGLLALATLMSLAAARGRPAGFLFATALLVVVVWAACGGGGGGSGGGPRLAPAVSLSTTNLSFGQVRLGLSSAAQNVTLTNTGNGTLSISGIALGGANPGDFAQTNTCGSSVAVGANCTINVTFTPTWGGSRSASLTIADNATGSPQTVSLTGTGVQPPTPPGDYELLVLATSGNDVQTLWITVTVQ
ncbi:MAG: Ig-like domain repeat protein [Acidobacteriia bacterium]|nr:Ig-like domain repeat protein [Terriglobia bacterium]